MHMIIQSIDSPTQPFLAPGFLGLSFQMFPLNYFLFLQIILFLFITPGTPRIVIISYSMNYGVQKCIWTALGDITANFIQGTLVIFVLGSFFSDNPDFLNVCSKPSKIVFEILKNVRFETSAANVPEFLSEFLSVSFCRHPIWRFLCFQTEGNHSWQSKTHTVHQADENTDENS